MTSTRHDPLAHPLDDAVARAPWFRPGTRLLAAVSGGPDSMALLAALHALAPHGVETVAAHFDHRMRAGSARDIDTVRRFAGPRAIEVVAGAGDVPARARTHRVSLETAARDARYEFLLDAALRVNADWIATAHTRSDQVETVLMRILRGAGQRGLAGIPRERGRIVRPLLDVTRADTVDYCARHDIPFVTDPSNDDRRFARNVLRNDTIPALRRAFPGLDEALLRTSRLALEALSDARLDTLPRLERALRVEGDRAWVLAVDAFGGLDAAASAVLLGDTLARIGFYDDIRAVHYDALLAMLDGGATGQSTDLPGVNVRRDHDALVFRARERTGAHTGDEATLAVPGTTTLGAWTVRAEMVETSGIRWNNGTPDGGVHVAFVSARSGSAPLQVRAPRTGERMRPFGMTGTKKLSDVFVDGKVPHRARSRAIVVEADGEIVWIPGVATGEAARVRPGDAMALRLVAEDSTRAGTVAR